MAKKRLKAAHALARFQMRHRFEVFRLDTFDRRRLIGRTGWDVLSPVKGTMQPLNRIRKLSRDAHEEEYLKLRAMGHIFKVKPNRTASQWNHVLLKAVNNSYTGHRDFAWSRVDLLLVDERHVGRLIEPAYMPKTPHSLEMAAANYSNPQGWVDELGVAGL